MVPSLGYADTQDYKLVCMLEYVNIQNCHVIHVPSLGYAHMQNYNMATTFMYACMYVCIYRHKTTKMVPSLEYVHTQNCDTCPSSENVCKTAVQY